MKKKSRKVNGQESEPACGVQSVGEKAWVLKILEGPHQLAAFVHLHISFIDRIHAEHDRTSRSVLPLLRQAFPHGSQRL